ncbi:MAG: hypothetical protein IPF92_29075 [Myxococcales bacterium]|nr:hypothetical protein [Myxococcales bacterium]MBL0196549.1 hypothetical protein [Myxococcales bacterium]
MLSSLFTSHALRALARLLGPALAVLVFLHAAAAEASVRKEGTWPRDEEAVTFHYEGTRAGGLEKLAEQAGWSLVLADKGGLTTPHTVSVSMKEQAPADVLDALLQDGTFAAYRKGSLVRIEVLDAGAPTAIAPAPTRAESREDAEDMKVMGGTGTVEKGQSVRNLTVMGGHCDVYGRVDGDVSVMGGSVVLHDGAVVEHDVTTMGGHVEVKKGAEVRGRASTLGGSIEDQDGELVSGHVDGAAMRASGRGHAPPSRSSGVLRRASDAVTNTALLFLLGVVFLAVAPVRMESLRVAVAKAPMRQLGLGVLGVLGFVVAVVLLCVTVVGIPFAGVGLMLGLVALYAGMVAALTTLGAALSKHKTENPYAHLAVGCGVFLFAYPLPWVGPWLVAALALVGVGTIVSTRVAGYFPAKKGASVDALPEGPYR